MPLIKVKEPFAKPPKLAKRSRPPVWDEPLETSSGSAELAAVDITNTALDLTGVERLDIDDCHFETAVLEGVEDDLEITLADSTVERCDLSRLRFAVVRQCRLVGAKLAGTDFPGLVRDVEFVDCTLRLTSFRMAELERVSFTNCTFEDVDAYHAGLTDITFTDTRLDALNLDQTRATRVDLRDAQLEGLKGLSNLAGYLIGEHQLPALAHQLADAVGLGIEDSDA